MNIEVTNLEGCKKNIAVEIPSEVAQQEFEKVSQKYAKLAMIPGFRPGKAPVSVIKRRFHNEIKGEVIKESIDKYFKEAIQDKKLNPISEPEFGKIEFEVGSPLKFEVTFETMPEFSITDYKGLEVSLKEKAKVTDDGIEEVLKQRQDQSATFVPRKGSAVKKGDLVTLNVESRIEGKTTDAIVDKGVSYQPGDPRFLASFTDQILGLKVGDEKNFDIEYEKSHPDNRFAGKRVHHKIEVIETKEKVLPEINDDFAKDLGEFENLAQLRERIRKNLEEMADRRYEEEVNSKLFQQLRDRHSIEVPQVLVNRQVQGIIQDLAGMLQRQGVDPRKSNIDWNKIVEENKPRATMEVQNILIMDQIAKKENLEPTDAEIEKELERLAALSGLTLEAVRAKYQKEEGLDRLRDSLRFKKALDFINKHAKIITEE